MTDSALKYSVIVPVYNRLEEVKELLESAEKLDFNRSEFEFLFVDDGSGDGFREFISSYRPITNLQVRVIFQQNRGPANARNNGMANNTANYMLFIDSDCILPPQWLNEIDKGIATYNLDAFGGPDTFHPSFSPLLKAINYSMTSFLTTGGIRGGEKKLDKFYPRSFNMGIRREVYEKLGGFSDMRFGEDIDFSIRLYYSGYNVQLLNSAWVYHKRRTGWKKFYRQVYNSGIARINLHKKHPGSLKPVHCMPAMFTVGVGVCLIGAPFCLLSFTPLILYAMLVFADATIKNRNLKIGFLSIISSYVQLLGYGLGFLSAVWNRLILKKGEFIAFEKNFYK